jgi:hydrogenase/urease accessory protein HupE
VSRERRHRRVECRLLRALGWVVLGVLLTLAPAASAHKGPKSQCEIERVPGGLEVAYTVFLGHSGFPDEPALSALRKEVSAKTPAGACTQRVTAQSKNASFRMVDVEFECPPGPITLHSAWVLGGSNGTRMHCSIDGETAWVFTEAKPDLDLGVPPSIASVMATQFRTGFSHVLGGLDHLLFLAVLLVAAAATRRARSDWGATKELLKIVTAFTVGHSITLVAGGSGLLRVPTEWVESIIALSIVVVAIENVVRNKPMARVWVVALFGMVHGLGFAAFQSSLELPWSGTLLSILAFNVGVEAGQLLFVVFLFPVLLLLSRRDWYRRVVLVPASGAVAIMGVIWCIERTGLAG